MNSASKKQKQEESDQLLVNEVGRITADEVIDVIATSLPGIAIAYKLAKAYMGRGMILRQRRALEWVEFVRDNIDKFSQNLFENEQFQDCFVLLTEAHTRERAHVKRKMYQHMLLGLTKLNMKDIEKFELEKMIQTTNQISFEALIALAFIKSKLLTLIEENVKKQIAAYHEPHGVERLRLEDITRSRILVSDYIDKWIHDNYSINSNPIRMTYGEVDTSSKELREKITYTEHLKRKELLGPLPELANLGIVLRKDETGGVGTGYSLSQFGNKYLLYLDQVEV